MAPTAQPRPAPVLLLALATHRLTRLVTTDTITAPARERIQDAAEARWAARTGHPISAEHWGSRIAYALSCAWCSSMWVAAGLVAVMTAAGHPPAHPVLTALAASSVTGLLAALEPQED